MADIHMNVGAVGAIDNPLRIALDDTSTASGLSELLGRQHTLRNGATAMLVKASTALSSPAKKMVKWTDSDAYTVEFTTSAGDGVIPCGVVHEDMGDIASGDYFYVIGGPPGTIIKCVDSGSGVTKSDFVQATATGDVVTDAALNAIPGVSFGRVEVTASADADVTVRLVSHIPGITT